MHYFSYYISNGVTKYYKNTDLSTKIGIFMLILTREKEYFLFLSDINGLS
jgi:hypothetical protein